ncbi:MAG: carboxymuconolactone decarboxylase family protein, partial [Treponema sp.]|nr:carboxymuconolactone decarboxylase family protein [Treponema sp.]
MNNKRGIALQQLNKSFVFLFAIMAMVTTDLSARAAGEVDVQRTRIRQTAGRDALGEFAPKFAELNDDVLFGEVWSRELELSLRDRSMITVAALISGGNFEQLTHHLNFAQQNGITRTEISEIITHLAFYVGWPKAWSAFNMATGIFTADTHIPMSNSIIFPRGDLITNNLFIGDTYLQMLILPESPHYIAVSNVTFSPGARNNWHAHDVGQFLLVTGGTGYYQEEGQSARLLRTGDVVNIPANIRHWHGAAPDSWFVHIAVTPGDTQWFGPLDDDQYNAATAGGAENNSGIAAPRQTAGSNALGEFSPVFAELNDDVLFGDIWSRELELSPRDRSMITVAALISGGNFAQLDFHLNFARRNGVTRTEISESITHLAFYVGWPKAWSAFNLATGVFSDNAQPPLSNSVIYPRGDLITNNLFIGDTYLQMLTLPESPHYIAVGNVTFSPGA